VSHGPSLPPATLNCKPIYGAKQQKSPKPSARRSTRGEEQFLQNVVGIGSKINYHRSAIEQQKLKKLTNRRAVPLPLLRIFEYGTKHKVFVCFVGGQKELQCNRPKFWLVLLG
jgi:hypothetical protein